jgi:uncharacterized protein (TIGR02266 family)
VPVFSLAALWNASATPLQAAEALCQMARWDGAAGPPEIRLALLELEVSAEVRLELTQYPRARAAAIAAEVERSGGAFVELWRLPKAERDAFRASVLGGPSATVHHDAVEAAGIVRRHLEALARRAPVRAARSERAGEALQAPLARLKLAKMPSEPAPAELTRRGPESRRARRYEVALEVEFRTAAEFAHEHAVNISRGGLFIRTRLRPELETVALVTVRLPTGETIQGEALVVHHREGEQGGVGLAFVSEDRAFSERLERYLSEISSRGG